MQGKGRYAADSGASEAGQLLDQLGLRFHCHMARGCKNCKMACCNLNSICTELACCRLECGEKMDPVEVVEPHALLKQP